MMRSRQSTIEKEHNTRRICTLVESPKRASIRLTVSMGRSLSVFYVLDGPVWVEESFPGGASSN
jgi:hypothetical protein